MSLRSGKLPLLGSEDEFFYHTRSASHKARTPNRVRWNNRRKRPESAPGVVQISTRKGFCGPHGFPFRDSFTSPASNPEKLQHILSCCFPMILNVLLAVQTGER